MRAIICGAMLALTISTANAGKPITANRMLPYCKAIPEHPDGFGQGLCLGVIDGLAAMAVSFFRPGQPRTATDELCVEIPNGVENGQIVRVVVRYIEARPNRMHEQFSALALEAIFDAWPCK